MKPQSKPFTVAVKRRKFSPEGKKKSVWSDVSHLIAQAESDLALELEDVTAETKPDAPAARPRSDAAPARQPRILQSLASDPEPAPEPEAEQPPVRRRGRPRKVVVTAAEIQPVSDVKPQPVIAEPAADKNVDAVAQSADAGLAPATEAAPISEPAVPSEKRSSGRRRERLGGLRAGERWKRHLPRWSR